MTEDDAQQIAARWMRDYPEVCDVIFRQKMDDIRSARRLTPNQTKALNFIRAYIAENGKPPTLREMADHFGYTAPAAAHVLVKALKKAGYITSNPKFPRSIRLV